jgi:hypothetical protein
MTNHCGTCTACCRVFEVPALNKPAGTWCTHCAIGKGCTIYPDRPAMCKEFECMWLMSQSKDTPLPLELRPDRSKVVLSPTTNENVIAATTMPGAPLAWQRPDVLALIKHLNNGGMAVVVGQPRSTRRTLFDRDGSHEVTLTEPDERGMQYNIKEQSK